MMEQLFEELESVLIANYKWKSGCGGDIQAKCL